MLASGGEDSRICNRAAEGSGTRFHGFWWMLLKILDDPKYLIPEEVW